MKPPGVPEHLWVPMLTVFGVGLACLFVAVALAVALVPQGGEHGG